MTELTLGSLFDGIAGFPLSASRYGIATKWASEIEAFPIKVSNKHFPDMEHLGDVSEVNGAEIESVDIISFGSPCQDMSVAGKREGLGGARSGLFMQAVRIIKEMRIATNGVYPRFAIWENVPGAFSSNNGQDFRAVLEEITEAEIPMPNSGRWAEAGMVGRNGRSVAWRVLDAQYWGVPQRRKRIFLVADFGGECAGEILFECEGLSGHIAESREAREEVATCTGDGIEATSRINCTPDGITGTVSSKWAKGTGGPAEDEHYNLICQEEITVNFEQTSDRITINPKVSVTLKAAGGGGGGAKTGLYLLPTYAFSAGNSEKAGSIGFAEEVSPTLRAGQSGTNMVPTIAFNTFGGNKRADRPNGGFYVDIPAEKAKPLDTNGTSLSTQQGGTGVLEPIAFTANQRDEVRDLGDKAGVLQAQPGMKQQTFIAQAFGPGGSGGVSHAIRAQASKADKPSSTTYIVEPIKCDEEDWNGIRFHCECGATNVIENLSTPCPACGGFCSGEVTYLRPTYAIQSGTMPNKSQNGLGVAEELMYTLDTRADHAVAHAVDVRNLCETVELSGTLQSKNSGGYSLNYQNPVRIGYRVRRLTPTECLRLQGFPDNWLDIDGASDSAKYKAVGNSVAEPCPDFIFERIVKILGNIKRLENEHK